ncbi:hypothetical protein U9M48_043415 [Paspalum notatum var. saurae]|uniref:Integrase catalytic domain-containing protein n=1 Tax=Paspalum notatum var. saurae TaxID=547442 RepID=A0AAQ3UUX1_PASNO
MCPTICSPHESLLMQDGGLENIWLMDFGCSRHLTGNHRWFSSLTPVSSSKHIIFGDKGIGKVKGVGAVPVSESFILRDVALVGNLGYNLLSVSQLLEERYEVRFKKGFSRVLDAQGSLVCPVVPFGKVFCVDFLSSSGPSHCLMAGSSSDLWKWHGRLGHLSFDLLAKLSSLDLIQGLPKLKSECDLVCHPCRHGKMVAASHTPVNQVMMTRPRELLHMDTVGPSRVRSVGGKWYVLVIMDDFSHWSWVHFMESKDKVFEFVHDLVLRLRNELGLAMRALRSDNGSKFKNDRFKTFCHNQGLEHQFPSPYVLQQNGVVERKNRTLVEMARMTPRKFWAEAINTACYVSNRIFLRAVLNKTSYELRFGRQPKVSHLRVFGYRCFVLKQGNLDKFEPRSSIGVFLGYATHSHAYRVWLLDSGRIVETCEVTFDETMPCTTPSFELAAPEPAASLSKDDEGALVPSPSTTWEQPPLDPSVHAAGPAEDVGEVTTEPQPSRMVQRDHPPRNIIGGLNERVTRSRSTTIAHFAHSAFVASFEPHDVGHALSDANWVNAMHEEVENFERNQVWVLVEPPPHCNPIGTKWVFKNKQEEDGVVAQASKGFKLFQMDVKSAFLNGFTEEEVYIRQTPQGTFVHQSKYTRDLLRKFEMADASPQMTPMSTSTTLDADEDGKEVDQKVVGEGVDKALITGEIEGLKCTESGLSSWL